MKSRAPRLLFLLAVFALWPAAAPARAASFELVLDGGYHEMSNARRSAEAVFDGSAGGATGGLSLRMDLGRAFFAELGGRYFQRTGERVFVASPGSPVFRLGHPLEVRILPVHARIGYRFTPASRLQPWVAVGGGITSYKEESTVAGVSTSFDATKPSLALALGLDYRLGSFLVGAEAGYSFVPNTIGDVGVSKVYGEDDVGGLTVVGRLGFRF